MARVSGEVCFERFAYQAIQVGPLYSRARMTARRCRSLPAGCRMLESLLETLELGRTHPSSGRSTRSRTAAAYSPADRSAATMPRSSAIPLPAMSKAVP